MDEDPFRPPWEDDEPPQTTSGQTSAGTNRLLIPLARAQDAVARLEARVEAAPPDVAFGLRARLALFEGSGYLAHAAPPCIRTIWRCAKPA